MRNDLRKNASRQGKAAEKAAQPKSGALEADEMHPENCNDLHTLKDFASIVHLSERTLYRLRKKGMPISSKVKRVVCRAARLWLAEHR